MNMTPTHSSFIPAGGWTPENVEVLTSMWIDGKSTREIATALGTWCTRNMVIGKAHRLGLPEHINKGNPLGVNGRPRKPAQPRKPRAVSTGTRKPAIATPEPSGAFVGPGVHVRFLGHHHCRFIEGEPTADALYCGAPVRPGRSYCDEHHARCWAPYHRRAA